MADGKLGWWMEERTLCDLGKQHEGLELIGMWVPGFALAIGTILSSLLNLFDTHLGKWER